MAIEKNKAFWQWPEYRWTSPGMDWKQGKVITCGIDVGSVSSQAAIMADGNLYAFSNMRTGSSSPDSASKALNWAFEGTGMCNDDLQYVVGTGYGRVNVPMANRVITEIACHSLGAKHIYGPSVTTILDVGGQDCKAILCDERGKVTNFIMNDKCAAGTGRGAEAISDILGIPVEEVGERSLEIPCEPPPVNSTCVVYAKTEAMGLLRKGWSAEKVLAAYFKAMAHRVVELLLRIGIEKELAITGGQSKNIGLVKRIEKELGIAPLSWKEIDPQIAGAIGAALFGRAIVEKSHKGK
ncbi:MAG: benzoyl-CoA reductase, bzd-type, subunit Q [Thermodesulfobacteriota bacterium]|nr:benzoyl-CoA reductase, bzd-type, subunit Q [Thermodesulfobacteriota bacterium]